MRIEKARKRSGVAPGVHGEALEEVPEEHPEEEGRQEAAQEEGCVPGGSPEATVSLAPKFEGRPAEDQANEDEEQGDVEVAEQEG
jgi:hypothetical protein